MWIYAAAGLIALAQGVQFHSAARVNHAAQARQKLHAAVGCELAAQALDKVPVRVRAQPAKAGRVCHHVWVVYRHGNVSVSHRGLLKRYLVGFLLPAQSVAH